MDHLFAKRATGGKDFLVEFQIPFNANHRSLDFPAKIPDLGPKNINLKSDEFTSRIQTSRSLNLKAISSGCKPPKF